MTGRDGVVLALAGTTDSTANDVCDAVISRGARLFRFDMAEFPGRLRLRAEVDGPRWRGELIRTDDDRVELDEIRSVYVRRPAAFEVPAHLSPVERWQAAIECRYGLGGVVASLQVPFMNHPSCSADAAYKPRQLRDFHAHGLITPPTLITNDPDAVRAFAAETGPLICKSIVVGVLRTGRSAHAVYTRLVTADDLADLAGVDYSAHLFQAFVDSEFAVRLTVVGNRFFAVRINAGSPRSRVDWRSDYQALSYQVVDTPADVRAGAGAYMKLAGLSFAAFDFLVGHDGAWTALEANAEGNFGWIEHETALPITAAIADFLVGENQP